MKENQATAKQPHLKGHHSPDLFREYDMNIRTKRDYNRLPIINSLQFSETWKDWDADQAPIEPELSVIFEHQMQLYQDVNFLYWMELLDKMMHGYLMHQHTENECIECFEYAEIDKLKKWFYHNQDLLNMMANRIFNISSPPVAHY